MWAHTMWSIPGKWWHHWEKVWVDELLPPALSQFHPSPAPLCHYHSSGCSCCWSHRATGRLQWSWAVGQQETVVTRVWGRKGKMWCAAWQRASCAEDVQHRAVTWYCTIVLHVCVCYAQCRREWGKRVTNKTSRTWRQLVHPAIWIHKLETFSGNYEAK